MLELKDFFHLPQVDRLIEQLVADRPGLVLVAGMDSRPASRVPSGILSGGTSTFFGVLARRMISEYGARDTILVGRSRDAVRVPASSKYRIRAIEVTPPLTYADAIERAARTRHQLIIVDQLDPELAALVLRLAQTGTRILSRLDCIFRGSGVARHLAELGVPRELFNGLRWIITVQRVATLCPECKIPARHDGRIEELVRRYPHLPAERSFAHSSGCGKCNQTGRLGEAIAFDLFRTVDPLAAHDSADDLFEQPSLLSMEEYLAHMAALGYVSLDDVLQASTEQLSRTFLMLTASERALEKTNTEMTLKLAELETAHRVLERRTESLISLQEIAHSLITSTELDDVARQICRSTLRLCGADRSILYTLRPGGTVEIEAVSGWDDRFVHTPLDEMALPTRGPGSVQTREPSVFRGYPPGIPARHQDVEGAVLRAGMRVPLVAQDQVVGMMIVHSTRKGQFAPGEIAMLQTLANQAAAAIQRANLIQSLREKITQLEAAQEELVKKERLERELELARSVQQSLLPRVFPKFPGYAFAACSETARRVGGDFYDVFRVDERHFGLVIADVSDKGMPAALFMALTKSLLFAEARRELSPRLALTSVHRLLLELGDPDMFVTAFYGVVDMQTRTLTYARAGHEQPLRIRGRAIEPLQGKGTVLGSLEVNQFFVAEEQVELRPGDRLVLFTDGVIDAVDSEEQPFGVDRFRTLIQKNSEIVPDELCRLVFASLAEYQGTTEQFDDVAMLVMDIRSLPVSSHDAADK